MITLTNIGTIYDAIPASQGLGIIRIDLTGVTEIKLDIRVNKVGTGTQTWQLWNETDGSEVGIINDAGTTGVKTLSGAFPINLSGEKVFRVRAKSTVAGDDPIFYGASVMVK